MKYPKLTIILTCIAVVAVIALFSPTVHADITTHYQLNRFKSRYYDIQTNLTRDEVIDYARHMDAIFEQYQKRFREFETQHHIAMPLFLLRTQDDYHSFMKMNGIDATNSGGMFFVMPQIQGLATWTSDKSRFQTASVLQHEGFHQFAWNYIGPHLPVWINEGIAQYFEDGIIVDDKMKLGLANAHRIEIVRQAIENESVIDFDILLTLTDDDWGNTLRANPRQTSLMYAQSWSIVYFLIHGRNGRYLKPLESYLKLVGKGHQSSSAFRLAFGTNDLTDLKRQWLRFARNQQPDQINIAVTHLEFIGAALRFMADQNETMPKSIRELRDNLRARQFTITRRSHNIVTEYNADDDKLYHYRRSNGSRGQFVVLEPSRNDLPPRITAPGLNPEPTLTWSRNESGDLIQNIEFR